MLFDFLNDLGKTKPESIDLLYRTHSKSRAQGQHLLELVIFSKRLTHSQSKPSISMAVWVVFFICESKKEWISSEKEIENEISCYLGDNP